MDQLGREPGGARRRARRLSHLPAALEARFGAPSSAVPDPDRRNAAVALILREPPASAPQPTGIAAAAVAGRPRSVPVAADPAVRRCSFLAIRRAESRRDPWSGQMALPGGALEPGDAGLLHAAIRESREETGVELAPPKPVSARPAVLGRIAGLKPLLPRVPPIAIWPFVFRVGPDAAARVASPEVASVHWFPVAALARAENRGTHEWRHNGVRRLFPCVRVDGQVIWGLTYRVLMSFLEATDGAGARVRQDR